MEEKETKTIKMEAKNEKMSYEQLENVAHQMSEQARNLYAQNQKLAKALEEANNANFFRRLEYLWTVINSETVYITEDFKIKCGEEFMTLMTPEEPKEEEDNK